MKDNEKHTTVHTGTGFCGLLGIAFIVLKLIGIIKWPWIWVLAPIWIPTAIWIVVFAVAWIILEK